MTNFRKLFFNDYYMKICANSSMQSKAQNVWLPATILNVQQKNCRL